MIRRTASLSAALVRSPRRSPEPRLVAMPRPSRWRDDLRLFAWAWAAGFLAFLLFLG